MFDSNSLSRRPVGTEAGIFCCDQDRIEVPFMAPGVLTSIEFFFADSAAASHACSLLQAKLENPDEPISHELRYRYNVDNLMEFLDRYLDHSQVVSVHWMALVRLESDGIRCRLPNETWIDIHPEDICGDRWVETKKPHKRRTVNKYARYACKRLYLPVGYDHEGWTRVSTSATDFFAD